MIIVIAAVGQNGELGFENKLCWRIPADLKRFMELTLNKTVIMGRKTYESIGRPLPCRNNIVVSSNPIEGVDVAQSLEAAIARAKTIDSNKDIYIIGGAQLYATALPIADTVELTFIEATAIADTFFPMDLLRKHFIKKNHRFVERYNDLIYYFITLIKKH